VYKRQVAPGAAVSGGLSFQLTVQGLTDAELSAMKKEYNENNDSKFFLSLENVSGEDVILHMRNVDGYAAGGAVTGKISSSTGSKGCYPLATNEVGGPELDVELGACRVSQKASDQFWETSPYILKLGEIGPQAKALVTGDDPYPAALIKFVVGVGKDVVKPTETGAAATKQSEVPADWIARVSKTPLVFGGRGPGVETAQKLVGAALIRLTNDASEEKIGKPQVAALRKLAGARKIEIVEPKDSAIEAVDNLVMALGEAVSGDPDGRFGEMTQLAVKIFQSLNSLSPDGRLGKDTASKLAGMFSAPGAISEHVINRWSRLAGLLVD
jgi:peptidoglycan hydrolase-like protein with peptidoglycan-binding domain